ncbi:MFS transporter [Nocardioides stalactiti]|uniref:MFS transporter n=1 Tax=Nocardioides stalactiti TaxID=2755356 RepID=UPI0015FF106B|nr:MFS transporter [Nocardioides stalactiti]
MTDTASDPRRWKALAVLGLVQFMLILDVTVVNGALPDIQTDLDFTETGLAWVVNGYVLMAGGLLLLGGRLADMLGRKKVFLAGVVLFGVASAACGAAANAEMLVIARFVQGIGEALAAPASLGLIALMFPDPQERIKALGLWGGIAGLGGTSGTVISGFLTELADWRWIFYINLPVAAFALIVVPRLVSESRMERASQHRPDVAGALTGTAGLIAIVYGLLEAVDHGWGSGNVLLPLLGGVGLIVAMVLIEARAVDPLIPLSFFRNRTRVVTNFVTLFFAAGFFSYFFLLTLFEQQVLGYSPIESGLSYLPFGLTIGAGIGLSTAMMPRLGVRTILTAGFAFCAAGLALTSTVSIDSGYASGILPGMVLLAFGSGISFPAFGNASLHEVTGQDSSLASGVQNAMQQVGGALGLATIVTIALTHAEDQVADGVLPPVALTDGFTLGWQVAVGLLVLGGVLVALLLENVLAVPRNVLAEEVAAEVGDTPA